MGTLEEGARNAVEVCMSVTKGEHILVLTDRYTLEGNSVVRPPGLDYPELNEYPSER